ncbi:MAG: tRNA dihydrouridine synthase DusB [Planctomycetota bacterium]
MKHDFKLGKTTLSPPILLAPMAGVSDLAFRLITRSFGCKFAFAEMVSARALCYGGKKTRRMIEPHPDDRPLGIQLLGSEPAYLQKAVAILNAEYRPEVIDLNAACPVRKVVRRGEGSGLMKTPEKFQELLTLMVRESQVPVTVKIRAGWDEKSINAVEMARRAADAGVKTVFIHGRTKDQLYKGKVDYGIIRQVKEAVKIPVIGSGDALSPELVRKMFEQTDCDAVAIARGALGNPWLFPQFTHYLKSGKIPDAPSFSALLETMERHFDLCCEFHGERIGVVVFRKFFYWYTKRLLNIRPLREKAFKTRTKEQMVEVLRELATARPCPMP